MGTLKELINFLYARPKKNVNALIVAISITVELVKFCLSSQKCCKIPAALSGNIIVIVSNLNINCTKFPSIGYLTGPTRWYWVLQCHRMEGIWQQIHQVKMWAKNFIQHGVSVIPIGYACYIDKTKHVYYHVCHYARPQGRQIQGEDSLAKIMLIEVYFQI